MFVIRIILLVGIILIEFSMTAQKLKFQFTDVKYEGTSAGWVVQDVFLHNSILYAAVKQVTSSITSHNCYLLVYDTRIQRSGLLLRDIETRLQSGRANFWVKNDDLILTIECYDYYSNNESVKSFLIEDSGEVFEYEPKNIPELIEFKEDELPAFYKGVLDEIHKKERFRHVKTFEMDSESGISMFVCSDHTVKLLPNIVRDDQLEEKILVARYKLGEWKTIYLDDLIDVDLSVDLNDSDGRIKFSYTNFGLTTKELSQSTLVLYDTDHDGENSEIRLFPTFDRDTMSVIFPEENQTFMGVVKIECVVDKYIEIQSHSNLEVLNSKRAVAWIERIHEKWALIGITITCFALWLVCTFLKFDPNLANLKGNIFALKSAAWSMIFFSLCTAIFLGSAIGAFRSLISNY